MWQVIAGVSRVSSVGFASCPCSCAREVRSVPRRSSSAVPRPWRAASTAARGAAAAPSGDGSWAISVPANSTTFPLCAKAGAMDQYTDTNPPGPVTFARGGESESMCGVSADFGVSVPGAEGARGGRHAESRHQSRARRCSCLSSRSARAVLSTIAPGARAGGGRAAPGGERVTANSSPRANPPGSAPATSARPRR